MNTKKSIKINIIITLTSVIVSVVAYANLINVKKNYKSSKLKSENLESLIETIRASHEEDINSIQSEYKKKNNRFRKLS